MKINSQCVFDDEFGNNLKMKRHFIILEYLTFEDTQNHQKFRIKYSLHVSKSCDWRF